MGFFVAFNIQGHIATVRLPIHMFPVFAWPTQALSVHIPIPVLTTALLETVVGGKLP